MLYTGHYYTPYLPYDYAVEGYHTTISDEVVEFTAQFEVIAVYPDGYFRATGPDILRLIDAVDRIAEALGTTTHDGKIYAI